MSYSQIIEQILICSSIMLCETHLATLSNFFCVWIALLSMYPHRSYAVSLHSMILVSIPFIRLLAYIVFKSFVYFTFQGISGITFIALLRIVLFNSLCILTDQEDPIDNALGYVVICCRWHKEANRAKSNKGRRNLSEFYIYKTLHLYVNTFCIYSTRLYFSDIKKIN